jgi:hypothetical protein
MPHVVTVLNEGSEQNIYVTTRANSPAWKQLSKIKMNCEIFCADPDVQLTAPHAIKLETPKNKMLFVLQLVHHEKTVQLRSVILLETTQNNGLPVFNILAYPPPYDITFYSNMTPSIQLAQDKINHRIIVLCRFKNENYLLYHGDFMGPHYIPQWQRMPFFFRSNTSVLMPDGLLFSPALKSGNSPKWTRNMVDLTECKYANHEFVGPYSMEVGSRIIPMKTVPPPDVHKSSQETIVLKVDTTGYYIESSTGVKIYDIALIVGRSYTVMQPDEGCKIMGYNKAGLKTCIHRIHARETISFTAADETSRLTSAKEHKNLNFSGSDVYGIRTHHGIYAVDGRGSDTAVLGKIEGNDFVQMKDLPRSELMEFAKSGKVVSMTAVGDCVYIQSQLEAGDNQDHSLWCLKGKDLKHICSLSAKIISRPWIYPEIHLNVFNTSVSHAMCLCAVFDTGRSFTCACAGNKIGESRSGDVFGNIKASMKDRWDMLYNNSCVDNQAETATDMALLASVCYCH